MVQARLDLFFSSLQRVLRPGARAVLQVYLERQELHRRWLESAAQRRGARLGCTRWGPLLPGCSRAS